MSSYTARILTGTGKGWQSLSEVCPHCGAALLQSPTGTVPPEYICVNCGKGQEEAESQSPESISSGSIHSRSSTPQTEISNPISSPAFDLPQETETSRRRREQSDIASIEIGKQLLKGWAMLAEECPSDACYGIPLIRPPKPGPEKDPRMECVICGDVYVRKSGSSALIRWNPSEHSKPSMAPVQLATSSTINSFQVSQSTQVHDGSDVVRVQTSDPSLKMAPWRQDLSNITDLSPPAILPSGVINRVVQSTPSTLSPLEISSRALELTLQKLSEKLLFLSSGQVPTEIGIIASTADAISRITQALTQVKQLQSSQRQII